MHTEAHTVSCALSHIPSCTLMQEQMLLWGQLGPSDLELVGSGGLLCYVRMIQTAMVLLSEAPIHMNKLRVFGCKSGTIKC